MDQVLDGKEAAGQRVAPVLRDGLLQPNSQSWTGRSIERKEDEALLGGAARFIADLAPVPSIHHAAILRSPHAHAEIRALNAAKAQAAPGIIGVLTGNDVAEMSSPISNLFRLPAPYYPCAVDRARYVGEPVAVVVAEDRYLAEDALDLIEVDYRPLPAVIDAEGALLVDAPVLHAGLGSNRVHQRSFRYGDPEHAFVDADRIISMKCNYPRVNSTPIETYGVIAQFETAPDRYTAWTNFQGPFVLQLLMSAALRVRSTRLRIITPPFSGGSFGIKQGLYPYVILIALASRKVGAPVKWIEDRLEHLAASSASTERITSIDGAFSAAGALEGLRLHQIDNVGAYLRPPEPATLYRMHGNLNGPYRVRNISVDNTVVLTNQLPAGLNRGYGGPQYVFPLERLMDRAAAELKIDPAEIRRRNFVSIDEFPYDCPSGFVIDSGDFHAVLERALVRAGYGELLTERERARTEGRLYGIGFATSVETSAASLAYVNMALAHGERSRGGPKSGAAATAAVMIDASGGISARIYSTPNGQGHATAAAQIVADELGVRPEDVEVTTEIDTGRDPWSITSGNYANRFSATVASALALASRRVADKIKLIAAAEMNVEPAQVDLANGVATARGGRNKPIPVARLAAQAHWNSGRLPAGVEAGMSETASFTPAGLTDPDENDRIHAALTASFLCDVAAVEVDRDSGRIHIRRYTTVHDVGRVLNPALLEGQVRGGFAHGLGAALYERVAYSANGTLLSSTFADYLCPTAPEIPPIEIDHVDTPSPNTTLGSKGLGDGSSMNAPAAICNAVADAIGHAEINPPLTPARVWAWMHHEPADPGISPRPAGAADQAAMGDGQLKGNGEQVFTAPREAVWRMLFEPEILARAMPGCREIVVTASNQWRANIEINIAGIGGRYEADIAFQDIDAPRAFRMIGSAMGRLGQGRGEARVTLSSEGERTRLSYTYRASLSGPLASFGHRFLEGVVAVLISEFFENLSAAAGGQDASRLRRLVRRMRLMGRAWRKV
jgi:2-furoyl-CoA dehydrogenase large subunit